jgi:hypothetical protein
MEWFRGGDVLIALGKASERRRGRRQPVLLAGRHYRTCRDRYRYRDRNRKGTGGIDPNPNCALVPLPGGVHETPRGGTVPLGAIPYPGGLRAVSPGSRSARDSWSAGGREPLAPEGAVSKRPWSKRQRPNGLGQLCHVSLSPCDGRLGPIRELGEIGRGSILGLDIDPLLLVESGVARLLSIQATLQE